MNLLKIEKYHILILVILSLMLFFWKINAIPLTDGDSAFYAKVAKNIVETGNWLTMHYGDPNTIIDKPPMFMWLTAASFKIFGINDFAISFWHSIFALAIIIITYQFSRLLFNSQIAFISSLVLLTNAQFFYLARSPLLDIPLTLFTLLAVYMFYLYERSGKLSYFYLMPVFTALGILTKGPVGLALPALTIFIYLIVKKVKLPAFKHILGTTLLFFALLLPWYIAEYLVLGQRFLDVLVSYNFGRYIMPVDSIGSEATKSLPISPQYDFYSYFFQVIVLMIPWSGFIYPAFYYAYKRKENILPVIFSLSVVLFFSLSLNYKVSRYILPAFPAISIIIGKLIYDSLKNENKSAAKLSIISFWFNLIVILPALLISTINLYNSFSRIGEYYLPLFMPFISVISLSLFTGSIFGLLKRSNTAFSSLISISICSYLILGFSASIYVPKLIPIRDFCNKIDRMARSSDAVCQYRGTDAHFMIYYSKHSVIFIKNKQKMIDLILSGKKVYCITENKEAYKELKGLLKSRIRPLEESANYTLFTNNQ